VIFTESALFKGVNMSRIFTLEYWQDDNWFVGKLKEIPGVFSQGRTLAELEKNIQDAYEMVIEAESTSSKDVMTKELVLEI
jgi:predicted RNase H-like HicB family nuclease